jgi:hypothetical protein
MTKGGVGWMDRTCPDTKMPDCGCDPGGDMTKETKDANSTRRSVTLARLRIEKAKKHNEKIDFDEKMKKFYRSVD